VAGHKDIRLGQRYRNIILKPVKSNFPFRTVSQAGDLLYTNQPLESLIYGCSFGNWHFARESSLIPRSIHQPKASEINCGLIRRMLNVEY